MALPIIPKKYFELKSKYLPKGKITLSPFNVGLENLLIQVKDAEEPEEKLLAIVQVVQECIQTPGISAADLPLFLIEEIFLRLRQNSIGELIDQQYQCTNPLDEEKVCNKVMPIQIDLREFTLAPGGSDHTNVVMIDGAIGIKFRYPTIAMFNEEGIDLEDEVETIISCIESVFEGDTVFPAEESGRDEMREFWKQISLQNKKDVLDKFLQSMPHMHYKKTFPCPACGYAHTIEFNSMQEVFQ